MEPDVALPIAEVVLNSIPFPVQIYRIEDGLNVLTNQAAAALWRVPHDAVVGKFTITDDPQAIELGIPAIFKRAAAGEVVRQEPVFYDASQMQGGSATSQHSWIQVTYFPIPDMQGTIRYVGLMYGDVTEVVEQRQSITAAQHEIESQRSMIDELSSPITRVWDGVLVVPIVGRLDELRATTVTESLLEAIVAQQASIVILDITGVPLVDTQVASYLVKATSACKLLGSTVVLVGIGSEIAQTIVHLGVDLSGIVTRSNLQAGILWAFERLGLQVVRSAAPVGAR